MKSSFVRIPPERGLHFKKKSLRIRLPLRFENIYAKIKEKLVGKGIGIMTEDKLTKGLPARIILETTIIQEEEVFKHSFDEMGRIVLMNDNYYIRFEEEQDGAKHTNLIKVQPNGTVQLTRHGANKTIMVFNDQEDTYTKYATPTGIMPLRVKTNRLKTGYNDQPFAGEVEVDYVIYLEDYPLGTYQLRLRFTT